jgi:nicotinamidase/pyrazinamidase
MTVLNDADRAAESRPDAATSMDAVPPQLERGSGSARRQRQPLARRLGLRAGDALICVDVQRDFLPGGALGVPEGAGILRPLNAYLAAFAARRLPIFLSRDWHPPDHCSFQHAGGRWPTHCVQHTEGAEWPAELHVPPGARIISKASDRAAEAHSAFTGTSLLVLLRRLDIRRVFVGGLATDYCVRATVLDALAHGFHVVLLADAIRAIDAQPGDGERAIAEMLERGATLFQASAASRRRPHRTPPQEA